MTGSQPVQRDKCEICHGTQGGVPGNENIINGTIVCDYCHADMLIAKDQPHKEETA